MFAGGNNVTYATGVVILDVGVGNVGSVVNVLRHLAPQLTVTVAPHADAANTTAFSHIILPGVGAFEPYLTRLYDRGFDAVIREHCIDNAKPLLGICLGMHALTNTSEEVANTTDTQGLGLIPGHVKKIQPAENQRLPHVGWNSVSQTVSHPVFSNIPNNADVYYTHSYGVHTQQPEHTLATTPYGNNNALTAVIGQNNIIATQCHPEKSSTVGMQLLTNFLNWDGVFHEVSQTTSEATAPC